MIIGTDGTLQAIHAKGYSLDANHPNGRFKETLTADLEALLSGKNLAAEYLSHRAKEGGDETTAK